ncbi:MAG: hypothetical protein H6Q86_4515 [candidate division NC10 bacterium]|nr:hypothetical protein [candidate division NC10 bacterium]
MQNRQRTTDNRTMKITLAGWQLSVCHFSLALLICPVAKLSLFTPSNSCRSLHNLREHGVEAPAQSRRHPPAIHRTGDAAPALDDQEHRRKQIGPGSVAVQMGDRAGRMSSALVHLMVLSLVR